jgi:threonine synthase
VTAVLEDSSGNGGASVAAYAAAGGMRATIMAPASTSPSKTVQMKAHSARVELIPGSRTATADAAMAAHGRRGGDAVAGSVAGATEFSQLFYASHTWHPFFLQGTKTLAYELWEDLGFRAPRNVIIPTGGGSNVLGCDIGFSELLRAGQIETLPRLFCAQPVLCAPIATAVLAALGLDDAKEAPAEWNVPARTLAEGTSISAPVRLDECVSAVLRSGGGAVRVSEEAMAAATLELAAFGLYTEPTCAQAMAAYRELVASGAIDAAELTVVVLTSTGVKSTPAIAQLLGIAL